MFIIYCVVHHLCPFALRPCLTHIDFPDLDQYILTGSGVCLLFGSLNTHISHLYIWFEWCANMIYTKHTHHTHYSDDCCVRIAYKANKAHRDHIYVKLKYHVRASHLFYMDDMWVNTEEHLLIAMRRLIFTIIYLCLLSWFDVRVYIHSLSLRLYKWRRFQIGFCVENINTLNNWIQTTEKIWFWIKEAVITSNYNFNRRCSSLMYCVNTF